MDSTKLHFNEGESSLSVELIVHGVGMTEHFFLSAEHWVIVG